jgi:ribosomal protein S18 acetylase RimI-like enzyme
MDQNHQGMGLGRDLLVEAIGRAAAAGEHAAARFIAVDPIDGDAQSFYGAFGFKAVEGDEGRRMYLRIDEALAALGEGQT